MNQQAQETVVVPREMTGAVEQACGLTVDDATSQPAEALSILRSLPHSQSLFVWADGSYRIAPTLDTAVARQEEGSLVAVIPMTDLSAPVSPDSDLLKEAVGHITRLCDWIEHEVGAELPYVEGEQDARAFLSKVEERG